jgi:hypothetical protein
MTDRKGLDPPDGQRLPGVPIDGGLTQAVEMKKAASGPPVGDRGLEPLTSCVSSRRDGIDVKSILAMTYGKYRPISGFHGFQYFPRFSGVPQGFCAGQ